ncbi:MAG TPA: PAS domain S-box protein [Chitinispirillaceae bacterium]|nr:PAS domain S-box protein [Chitinispirillaceae bacterium]
MVLSAITILLFLALSVMTVLYIIAKTHLKSLQQKMFFEKGAGIIETIEKKETKTNYKAVQEYSDVHYLEINRPEGETNETRGNGSLSFEEDEFELNSFYFAALDLLCVLDTSGFFKKLNNQWELNTGYQKKDLIDTEFYGYLHKEDLKSVKEFVESMESDSDTANFICRFRNQDGTWKWLEWRLTRYGKWIYGAARDISERKNDEDTLKEIVNVSVKTPSEGFFGAVCEWLRIWLNCDLCLIIEIDESRKISIVAVASSEQVLFTTALSSTDQLIGLTIDKGYCHYSDNIDVICPESLFVTEYAFRGYTGVCLYDKHNNIKGVLCFLSQSELHLPSKAQEVFQIIAVRASAEMEHLQAEDKYSSILNTAMDCFALVDTNGKIIDVNQAYCTLLGFGKKELLSMSISDIDASDNEERMQLRMDLLINGGHDRFESRHRCKDGRIIDLEISINFLKSGSGKYVMFIRDISERKKTEAAFKDINERLTLATRAAGTGIWDWDVLNNILVWNDQMFELYGKNEHETNATMDMWRNSIHPEDREKVMAEIDLALKGIIEFNSEFRIILPDGSIKHARVLSKVYKNDSDTAIRMIGMNWDITMEKETQIELRNAIDAADRANRSKSEFIANMSHEIRTPLNAVIGFSELLESLSKDNKQKQYINSIMTAGKSLLRIINDILDMSKIEAGMMKVQYEPMQLSLVCEEIRQIFNQRIEEKGLQLLFEFQSNLPEILYLDEIRLRQVLLNIVGNSVKFTDTGSIKVEVTAGILSETSPDSTDIEITITDTGLGIPLEEQQVIFEPFHQRSGQNATKYGGTGLGLSISKKLTELMNGELSVESQPGKGASFKLKLKNVKYLKTEKKRVKKNGENFQPCTFSRSTILVADDIESNRQMLKEHLVNAGLDVLEAENGESAVAVAIEKKPQLIFMDIRMPGLSGIDAMKKLREIDDFKETPIIALSASNYLDEINKNDNYVFSEYIPKPVENDTLMNVLSKYIPKASKSEKNTKRQGKEKTVLTPDLKILFKKEFEQKIENFSGAIKMQLIRSLIGEFHLFSTEHSSTEIDAIAVKLERAVEAYDIEKIRVLLKKCMELCK